MRPFAIAAVQMPLSALHSNVEAMCAKVDGLMYLYPWVQMVLFSELAPHGPSPAKAEPLPGPAEETFRALAVRHGIWLVPGSMFEKRGENIFNTASVIDPEGSVVARYSKMFPFRPYEMDVRQGDRFVVWDIPDVGRFGISICYDMWFPETTRTLVSMGAEVILHPSMTPTIDRDVELSIARASAAINQCFFFDVNGVGDGGNGRSIIVGPYGDIIHQAGDAAELMPVEIDLDRVRRSREVGLRGLGQPLKSFRDRRVSFDVYSDPRVSEYLRGLGPLEKPHRGSRAGLESAGGKTAHSPGGEPVFGWNTPDDVESG